MSRQNKVNRDHYVQRGRLTPDEAARERMKQQSRSPRKTAAGRPDEPAPRAVTRKDKREDEEPAEE